MLGILSTNSNIFSDLVLILQWIIFIVLLIDWYIARKRDIKNHKRIILSLFTLQTIFNTYMILRLLFGGFQQIPVIMVVHGFLGFLAYILIVYTILYMTKNLPESLRVIPKESRTRLMQLTTIVWLFFTTSGSLVYATLYL